MQPLKKKKLKIIEKKKFLYKSPSEKKKNTQCVSVRVSCFPTQIENTRFRVDQSPPTTPSALDPTQRQRQYNIWLKSGFGGGGIELARQDQGGRKWIHLSKTKNKRLGVGVKRTAEFYKNKGGGNKDNSLPPTGLH